MSLTKGIKADLRIIQIDLARQKERIDYIQSYVRFAKKYRYNAVLLYLENAVRTEDTPFFDEERTYSMDEMREIVSVIEREGMMAIPAFENLDHMENFLIHPELSDLAEYKKGSVCREFTSCENGSCGCVSNPRLYEFMNKYITDIASLFSSPYIHMGLDEPFDFCICEKCRARLAAGETKADIFLEHVMKSYNLVKSLGKEMMMWDDFFAYIDIVKQLPRDIIMCNWNYNFIGNEPEGLWTNRKKCDWFRLYDELGFKYLFCTKANATAMLYNIDSFTDYAKKYSPIGAVMTSWEHSHDMYLSTYPSMAYGGMLWSGEEFDKEELYAEVTGDKDIAKLLLSMNIPLSYAGPSNVHLECENDYFLNLMLRTQLKHAVSVLREKEKTDIALDIYDKLAEHYLNMRVHALGTRIFDIRQSGGCDFSEIYTELDAIERGFIELRDNVCMLWEKYRSGIKSSTGRSDSADALNRKYNNYLNNIRTIREFLKNEKQPVGILYADLMLHDLFATVRGGFRIKYEGNDEPVSLNVGIKGGFSNYYIGGAYFMRYLIENKKIEYILFDVWGEGALYPLNFRYLADGKLYVASEVEAVSGYVRNEANLLKNDTQFAELGCNDGDLHFEDIYLSKVVSTVKVSFKPFV